MEGIKAGTVLTIGQFRYIVESTDEEGNCSLKKISAEHKPKASSKKKKNQTTKERTP